MRKIVTLSLAAASLAGAGVAYAQAEPRPDTRAERPPLTRTEVEQRSAERFARMDINHDGKLDQADRTARREAGQQERFARLDTDNSGTLSLAEFSAPREQRGELRAERRGPDGPRGGFRGGRGMARAADADNDGAVTQAEFASAALARFDRVDANKDGTISADERPERRRPMRRQRDAG